MATKKKVGTKKVAVEQEVDGNVLPEFDDVVVDAITSDRVWAIRDAALSLLQAKARGNNGNIYPGDVDNMIAIATELADKLGLK